MKKILLAVLILLPIVLLVTLRQDKQLSIQIPIPEYRPPLLSTITTPDVDLSCEQDSDCIAISGTCDIGCYWLMNQNSVPDARAWLDNHDDDSCSLSCPEPKDVACQNNLCMFVD